MANALEAASLVMIPSGYEDGTLGSLKPTDGSGDFTFTRGSNLSATRVNEDGYIEKGYENLLLQSNSFTTTWTNYLIDTPTSGQAGYDGTSNAWLIECANNSNFNGVRQVISTTGVTTLSVYAKAGTTDYLGFYSSAGFGAFELTGQGSVGTIYGNGILGHIELISNGWYRCSIVLNGNASAIIIGARKSINSFNADIGDSIYIQDAMLNQGLVAYPYVETTTAPVAGGILEDMPRLDWSGSCPSLLLEPSRTNVFPDSEYFDGSFWSKGGNADIENNAAISPEGIKNASKFYGNTTAYTFTRLQGDGAEFRQGRTLSVFAKAGEVSEFLFFSGNLGQGPYFNLNDGSITGYYQGDSSEIDDAYSIDYGNGWYRCVAVFSANSYPRFFNSENQSITFNQTAGNGIYLYGFQAEQDATYPTSYIPTYGTSQTRLADDASNTNTIDADNDFTFYFESTLMPENFTGKYFDNQSNGYLSGYNIAGSNLRHRYSGTNYTFTAPEGVFKYLIRKDSTNMKFYLNGVLEYTITTLPTGTGDLELLGGKVYKTLLFPTALSDDECIALTTI